MSSVSVPTKCILFGEHLALRGFEAMAIPLMNHRYELGGKLPFPAGVGAGISAAQAVAEARSRGLSLEWVNQQEEETHGRASGLDAAAIFYERPVALRNGELEVLNLELLDSPIFAHCRLYLSGIPKESTKEMIEKVIWEGDLKRDGFAGVEAAVKILKKGDVKAWIFLMNQYGLTLEKLGAVSEKEQQLSAKLRLKGLGVKVCGAGGFAESSGLMLLCASDPSVFEDLGLDLIAI